MLLITTCFVCICVVLGVFHNHHENTYDLPLDNQWIPNDELIKAYDEANNNNKKGNKKLNDTRAQAPKLLQYQPSIDKYPLNLFQNITTPIRPTDVIFQWHIPKAAGTTMKELLTKCFHLSRAENRWIPQSLEFRDHILNIDTAHIASIAHAQEFGLVQMDLLDVITSSYLHEGAALLTEEHKGRLFTVMRHPVDAAISMFFYLGNAHWESDYKEIFKNMTLMEYVMSDEDDNLRVSNWMTRYLSRKPRGELQRENLQLAKDILKYKCLVGMSDNILETMRRFEAFMGIKGINNDMNKPMPTREEEMYGVGMKCVETMLNRTLFNTNKHEKYEAGMKEWDLLSEKNAFDVELYQFARELWDDQAFITLNSGEGTWNHRQTWGRESTYERTSNNINSPQSN